MATTARILTKLTQSSLRQTYKPSNAILASLNNTGLRHTLSSTLARRYFKNSIDLNKLNQLNNSEVNYRTITDEQNKSLIHLVNPKIVDKRFQQIINRSMNVEPHSGRNGQDDGLYTLSINPTEIIHHTGDACARKLSNLHSLVNSHAIKNGILFDIQPGQQTTVSQLQSYGDPMIRFNNPKGTIPIHLIALSIATTSSNNRVLVLDKERFDEIMIGLMKNQVSHIKNCLKFWDNSDLAEVNMSSLSDIHTSITDIIGQGSDDTQLAMNFSKHSALSRYIKSVSQFAGHLQNLYDEQSDSYELVNNFTKLIDKKFSNTVVETANVEYLSTDTINDFEAYIAKIRQEQEPTKIIVPEANRSLQY